MLKSIIFDFGNVLIPAVESRTHEAFEALRAYPEFAEQGKLFRKYETGKMDTNEFLEAIRPFFFRKHFKPDLKKAWNAMLGPLPEENVRLLKKLKRNYKLFLLSNTNDMHISCIQEQNGRFLYNQFMKQFDAVYYSHEIGMRKPDREIFDHVLKENDLQAEESLFIDDKKENIDTADEMGLKTWHLDPETESIDDLDRVLSEHR